jgi:hypothetical protein
MNSSDLFSHPDEPEVVPNRDASNEPVQPPAFSDRPRNDLPRDAQKSS